MARIHPDLTIDHEPCTTPAYGLMVQGHIHARGTHLRDLFGEPARSLAGGAEPGAWTLDSPAGRVHLAARQLRTTLVCGDSSSCWLILGAHDAVLPWAFKAVTGSTANFVAGAQRHFSESTLATFTSAYTDYLFQRADAAAAWGDRQDWNDPRYPMWRHWPAQLHTAANALLTVLHHYQWSQATDAQRRVWASMGRPVPGGSASELEHWREKSRWLYSPIKTVRYPHGGDPDLAGMLLRLADNCRDHRPLLIERNPRLDVELFDEHEQTLRNLATTAIPGLDALSPFTR
ncbi:hypothetical protein DL991_41150 [Amycolatopsis sp. WAC 01375]|uniref:hypothetical protein n=1 Tax=Amycolatopsis sp. WAC 01375 TaxID=2203194 RepID=UPI000F783AB0|nr:hypothetical protein [Amycolatopsis sp. WAC 01375]RSM68679.1 hypothetical protein DL991_41150 [Amycolatopsis sp. WAC 01375]